MKKTTTALAAALLAFAVGHGQPATAQAQTTLRIGLNEDPDTLDPTLARTFVSRIVFMGLCDKLIDYDKDLNLVPQLAQSWEVAADGKSVTFKLRPGVTFHDGEPFDAEAVRFNMDRHLTLPETRRRSEISVLAGVVAVDPLTVRMDLKEPFSPFLSLLADRAGMMVSPKAARELGPRFATQPVCAGPYRFVERVVQDRIVLERYPNHWDKGNFHFDRVVYQPIPDTTVRLANLQAGQLDMLERLQPSDLATVRADRRLTPVSVATIGYQGITINVGNGPRADNPLGRDARLRRAFELSLDREVINQVAWDGAHTIGNQAVSPTNFFFDAAHPIPGRDLAAAQRLIRESGVATPIPVELIVQNSPPFVQTAQIIQAMAGEAGFDVKIVAMEFAAALAAQTRGEFQAFQVGWSGRIDPDGNIHVFWHSRGSQNDRKYNDPKVDQLVDAARVTNDRNARKSLYAQATAITQADASLIYLWHPNNIFVLSNRLTGFQANPDGLIRLQGLRFQ